MFFVFKQIIFGDDDDDDDDDGDGDELLLGNR